MFEILNINQEASASKSNSEVYCTMHSTPIRNKRKIKDPFLKAADASEKFFRRNDDELDLFGRTCTQQLCQLPLEAAIETEELILSTIRRQRTKLSKHSSSQSGPSSSAPEGMESTRIETITIPEDQQVSQLSEETESIASASDMMSLMIHESITYTVTTLFQSNFKHNRGEH